MALYIGSDEVTGGATFTYNGVQVKQLDVKETPSSTPVTVWRSSYSLTVSIPTALSTDVTVIVDGISETVTAGNTFNKSYSYEVSGSLDYEIITAYGQVTNKTLSNGDRTVTLNEGTASHVAGGYVQLIHNSGSITFTSYDFCINSIVSGPDTEYKASVIKIGPDPSPPIPGDVYNSVSGGSSNAAAGHFNLTVPYAIYATIRYSTNNNEIVSNTYNYTIEQIPTEAVTTIPYEYEVSLPEIYVVES